MALVSQGGEVTLLLSRGNDILLQRCEDHSVLKTQSDCRLRTVDSYRWATIEEFSSEMKKALNLLGDYDANMIEVVKHYQGVREDEVVLESERTQLEKSIKRINDYVAAYGDANADKKSLHELKAQLNKISIRIEHMKIVRQAEGIVVNLINQAKDPSVFSVIVIDPKKPSFEYNILRNYVKRPKLALTFAKIGGGEHEVLEYFDDVKPVVKTIYVDSFEIQTTEVTQAQYFMTMKSNPSEYKERENCPDDYMVVQGVSLCPNHPVENISWRETSEYAGRLSKELNVKLSLPTLKEWRAAAQANSKFVPGTSNILSDEYVWDLKNSGRETHPVALKKPNPNGLYDMYGNVSEWTHDSQSIGGGFAEGVDLFNLFQGHYTSDRKTDLGFRLVREIEKTDKK